LLLCFLAKAGRSTASRTVALLAGAGASAPPAVVEVAVDEEAVALGWITIAAAAPGGDDDDDDDDSCCWEWRKALALAEVRKSLSPPVGLLSCWWLVMVASCWLHAVCLS